MKVGYCKGSDYPIILEFACSAHPISVKQAKTLVEYLNQAINVAEGCCKYCEHAVEFENYGKGFLCFTRPGFKNHAFAIRESDSENFCCKKYSAPQDIEFGRKKHKIKTKDK